MSHRKIRSAGYVPFSWEEKPGVPKSHHQKMLSSGSDNMGQLEIQLMITMTPGNNATRCSSSSATAKIIPPPPAASSALQPPRKSYSGRVRWQDDPFLAAFKSCTKTDQDNQELRQKSVSNGKNVVHYKKSSNVFSCKQSCNVENGNLVKLSKLPPLPKERYSARAFVKNK